MRHIPGIKAALIALACCWCVAAPAHTKPGLSGTSEWLADFVNELGKDESERKPNSRLRIPHCGASWELRI